MWPITWNPLSFLILCVWVTVQSGGSPSCPVLMLSVSRFTSQSTQTITPTHVGSAALIPHCRSHKRQGAGKISLVWSTALVQGRGPETLPSAGHWDHAVGGIGLRASRGAAHTPEEGQPPGFRAGADTWQGGVTRQQYFTWTQMKPQQAVPCG